jgi:hypothetical protein
MVILPLRNPAPSLTQTVSLLRDLAATDDERDLLAAAEWVTEAHTAAARQRSDGSFGSCEQCAEPWPCPSWRLIESETLAWLVARSTQALRRSRAKWGQT